MTHSKKIGKKTSMFVHRSYSYRAWPIGHGSLRLDAIDQLLTLLHRLARKRLTA